MSKLFSVPHERKRTLFDWFTSFAGKPFDFEKLYALRNINLEVQRGEFLGVIGKNGSGKSTLLKVISRIYLPTEGEVVVGSEVFPLLDLAIGFQPEFTCTENIYLYGATLGFTRKQLSDRLRSIIEFAELERFVDAKLRTFSTGMILRLAFAIAIQSDAPIFLVDEGLAVGDWTFWLKCEEEFREFKANGRTVVFVSHDLNAVQKFCDRVVIMDEGTIFRVGNPAEMIEHYASSEAIGTVS